MMTALNRRLLRASRLVHRWLGLIGFLYFLVMALSGVLLNHPEFIAGISLSRPWIPGDYAYRDWNRNSLRGVVRGPDARQYLFGEAGVWRLDPGTVKPQPLNTGLDPSVYYRDIRALRLERSPRPFLLAGTRGGLYYLPIDRGLPWEQIGLGEKSREAVVDLVRVGNRILAVTRSRVYSASLDLPLEFADATPPRDLDPNPRVPLFRSVFHMHSGEMWGLAGRLAVDLIGAVLAFLTVTGGYFWWKKRRRALARGAGGRWARAGLTWHTRLGLWMSPLLLFVVVTGLFQRPPFLIAIVNAAYPARYHPAPEQPNPWHDLLRKALHDPARRVLVLATADGFFEGPEDLSQPFRKIRGGPPVSVMGATVFQPDPMGRYWVGSMSGLYLWNRRSGQVTDAFTGGPPAITARGPVGDHKVVGFVPGREPLVADYEYGAMSLRGWTKGLPVPEALERGGRISLWHALFEFHNGRMFGFLLGWWAWLVVPLGGLAFSVEIVTGVFDRFLPRAGKR